MLGTFQTRFISRVQQCSMFSRFRIICAMQCYLLYSMTVYLRQISSVEFSMQAVVFSCCHSFHILTGYGPRHVILCRWRKLFENFRTPDGSRWNCFWQGTDCVYGIELCKRTLVTCAKSCGLLVVLLLYARNYSGSKYPAWIISSCCYDLGSVVCARTFQWT